MRLLARWTTGVKLLEPWSWVLRYVGLAALFLVVYLLILRPVKKQAVAAFRELPARFASRAMPHAAGAPPGLAEGTESPVEGQRATQLKTMLIDKVKAEPAAASRLVESWVREHKQV